MTKYPIIGGVILLVSLAIGAGGSRLALANDDIILAALAAFIGLFGILAGGFIMHWGAPGRSE